ncbi:MAG: hypothetical protein AAGE83_08290, partial [Pseudomonadota bacterium]
MASTDAIGRRVKADRDVARVGKRGVRRVEIVIEGEIPEREADAGRDAVGRDVAKTCSDLRARLWEYDMNMQSGRTKEDKVLGQRLCLEDQRAPVILGLVEWQSPEAAKVSGVATCFADAEVKGNLRQRTSIWHLREAAIREVE